jgi:heme/copper-type cytochrome/quinol oxidase subunit 2
MVLNIKYLIIAIITIIVIIILFVTQFEYFNDMSSIDTDDANNKLLTSDDIILIIARYNEDLEWLKEEPFNKYDAIVYNKGDNDNFYKSPKIKKIINLKNVGREPHTYLYHIITNYNNLNNINVFLPGSIDHSQKKVYTMGTMNEIEKQKKAIFLTTKSDIDLKVVYNNWQIDYWESSNINNKKINLGNELKLAEYRPFNIWFEKNFGDLLTYETSNWGIFSMSRDNIIKNDIEHYNKFLIQLDHHHNLEVVHYIERCWHSIFNPK